MTEQTCYMIAFHCRFLQKPDVWQQETSSGRSSSEASAYKKQWYLFKYEGFKNRYTCMGFVVWHTPILQSAPSKEKQPVYTLWPLLGQRKWQMSYLFLLISHQGLGILPGTLDPVLFTGCTLQSYEQAKILPWCTHKAPKTSICSSHMILSFKACSNSRQPGKSSQWSSSSPEQVMLQQPSC